MELHSTNRKSHLNASPPLTVLRQPSAEKLELPSAKCHLGIELRHFFDVLNKTENKTPLSLPSTQVETLTRLHSGTSGRQLRASHAVNSKRDV